ncbi:MAG: hypothetical protein NZ879_01210, partial [Archaeoglobaceae archaeon]|nr:hypothetical protein [Archaeoglobaceae archaeon]MDW8117582.1 hypothetical protein [Archaeoglobaceae archaeon]
LALWDFVAKSKFSFTALGFILTFLLLFTSIPQIFLFALFFSFVALDIAKLKSFKAFLYYFIGIALFAVFWQLSEIFENHGMLLEVVAVISFVLFALYAPFLKLRRAV